MGRLENIGNREQNNTSNELQQLRREILWKEFDKRKDNDIVLSKVWKEDTIDYLLAEWKDKIKLKRLFKWIILSFSKSLKELKEYSEKLKNCDTINELNSLEGQVLSWINNPNLQEWDMNQLIAQQSSQEHQISNVNINIAPSYFMEYKQLKLWAWVEKLPNLIPFSCALKWYKKLKSELKNPRYLSIVDFTKPNSEKRFYVIDMVSKTVVKSTTVWHWDWSWTHEFAEVFSNKNGSHQSSLWFYRTPDDEEHPSNRNRSWLRMKWIEDWNNSAAASRWIFMHPWWLISQWCFTLPGEEAQNIINNVKWDSLLFAYARSKDYFNKSQYFDSAPNWDVIV